MTTVNPYVVALEGVPLLKHVFTIIFGPDVISGSKILKYIDAADEITLEVLEKKASQFNRRQGLFSLVSTF